MRRAIEIVACVGLAASSARILAGLPATVIHEAFSSYAEGALPTGRWERGGLGWSVRDGRLRCEAGTRSTAVPASAPHASAMVFEAILRPERSQGAEWKTAGIAIAPDDANFWQLSLVEGPNATGRARTVELHEMLKGRWLANLEGPTALQATVQEGGGLVWEYGRDYRLRLALTPEAIAGSIEEVGSDRRYRVRYALTGDCVRTGRPMLSVSGLVASYASFRAEIGATAAPPPPFQPPPYSLKPMSTIRRKATGFFRVEKLGDRWWVIDPKGFAFYVVGTDHVNYNAHWCEKLGYAPYSRNVKAKFGSEDAWAASATDRLKQWGFNTLGAGHSESTRYRGLAHTAFLSLGTAFTAYGDIAPRTTWTGFPDVFDPRFAEFCEIEARKQCAPHRKDPWLLGYFLDNELEWFGKNGSETGLVDETMKKPADHSAKRAFISMLRSRYAAIGDLNARWKTSFGSWEELAEQSALPASASGSLPDRRDFVRLIAERYFAVTCAAIRKADPNHMILGCRFAGFAPPIWDIAGRHLDIVSVNYYGNVDLERGTTTDMPAAMARYHRDAKRPLMITEWSFPALDAGLPSRNGAGQRVPTQRDKARAYAIYQTALFAMPYMVGSDYFMWVDEPALGISSTFPEDSNYGLVDVNDRAWPELTAMAAKANPRAVALHGGQTAEVSASIMPAAVVVRNSGKAAARFTADVTVQGRRSSHRMFIGPGQTWSIPLTAKGAALVRVELDRAGELFESRLGDNTSWRVIGAPPISGPTLTVVNPGSGPLKSVPVSVRLPKGMGPVAAYDANGRRLPSQVDRLPTGDELAVLVPDLPARTARVLALRPSSVTVSRVTRCRDGAFRFEGALQLMSGSAGTSIVDSVALGDLKIGRLTVLVHQTNGQPLWLEPQAVTGSTVFEGPVRTVRLADCSGGAGPSGARTAVDTAGVYAARTSEPHRFTVRTRLDCYPGEQWFDIRVLEVLNVDSRPWKLESCFIYPVSAIAGSASNDLPGGTGDLPRWHDAEADASYGAHFDPSVYRGYFWKDAPDGEAEHADIYRVVRKTLKPRDTFAPTRPDPAVRVFASKGDAAAAGNAIVQRLRALQGVRTTAGTGVSSRSAR